MSQQFSHGYALLVGVGTTAFPDWSLPVTVADVKALQSVLADAELCGYPDTPDHIRMLHDTTATRRGILDGLIWLRQQAKADPKATVVVAFSGHGWVQKTTGAYYLIPHNVKPYDIAGSALAATTFTQALRDIPAQRLLVFVDSCHAEGMATAKAGATAEPPPEYNSTAPPKGLLNALSEGSGRAVFTSSRGSQLSWVRSDGKMSLYTYHLLEALQGADNRAGDTVVTLANLMHYLGRAVPESARAMGYEQTPYNDFAAEDFPVALLLGGKGLPAGGWGAVTPLLPGIAADRGSVAAQGVHAPVAASHAQAAGGSIINAQRDVIINPGTGTVRTGGIHAGKIKAENVVHGIQAPAGALKEASRLVKLAQAFSGGGITADEIKARNVIDGVHIPAPTSIEGLRDKVAALRRQVAAVLAAGEVADIDDVEELATALEHAQSELEKPTPNGARVIRTLKTASEILTGVAQAAAAAGKAGWQIFKLAPVAAALWKLAETLF